MDSFEKQYYEASRFWEEGVFDDVGNIEHINTTIALIPDALWLKARTEL